MLALLVLVWFLPVVSPLTMTCNRQGITCHDRHVHCECQKALNTLIWTVTSLYNTTLFWGTYLTDDSKQNAISANGYTAVLIHVDSTDDIRLTSILNFTFVEDVRVKCHGGDGQSVVSLQRPGQ